MSRVLSLVNELASDLKLLEAFKAYLNAIRRVHEGHEETFRRLLDHYSTCPHAASENGEYRNYRPDTSSLLSPLLKDRRVDCDWETIAHNLSFALIRLVNQGDPHEIATCPGDDTCICDIARAVNTSLHAYFERSGVPLYLYGREHENASHGAVRDDRPPRS